jgi:hypothetical protein
VTAVPDPSSSQGWGGGQGSATNGRLGGAFSGAPCCDPGRLLVPRSVGVWIAVGGALAVCSLFVAVRLRAGLQLRLASSPGDEGLLAEQARRRRKRFIRLVGLSLGGMFALTIASGVSVGVVEQSFPWGLLAAVIACIAYFLAALLVMGVVMLLRRRP